MIKKGTAAVFGSFAVLISAFTATAEEKPASSTASTRLKEVVIQDSAASVIAGADKPLAEFPGSAAIVSQKEIEETKPLSTIDALQSVPGVNLTTEDGRGLRPNVGFRGIDPDRSREGVILLADGAPIQPALYGDKSAYYNVPVEIIDHIDVIKGASSVLYGPGNVGGVVNYITKRPPASPGKNFEFSEVIRQGGLASTALSFGATGASLVGTRMSYVNKAGSTVRENTETDVHDFNLRTIVPTDDKGELSFRINYYHEDVDTPGGLTPELFNEDPDQSVRSQDQFQGERIAFDVHYTQPLGKDLSFETLVYSNFFRRDWYLANNVDAFATSNNQFLREFQVFGVEPRLHYGTWILGTRLHYEQMDDIGRLGDTPAARRGTLQSQADLSTVAWATYLQKDIEVVDDLTLTPGVRYEHVEQRRDAALRTDPELGPVLGTSGSALTQEVVGALNTNYRIESIGNLFGGVQRSFEPPTFNEAIDPASGTDNDLDAERAWTYEAGIRTPTDEIVSADLTFFWLTYDDKIINEAGKLRNAGETEHKGIELGLTARPTDRLTAYTGVTLLDTEFETGATKGNDLPMAPNARVSWAVGYQLFDPLKIRLDGVFVGDQYTDAANTKDESIDGNTGELPSYHVLNVRGEYALPKDLFLAEDVRLFLGVNNVLDEEYRERRQAAMNGIIPGLTRSVYGGLEVRF